MRILITGSQLWTDKAWVFEELDWNYETYFLPEEDDCEFIVVQGACPNGADAFAVEWANLRKSQGLPYIIVEDHPADWTGLRKRGAGYARNAEMVALGADRCLAFILDESPGSTHCAGLAEKAGIETIYFRSTSMPGQALSSTKLLPRPYKRVEEEVTLRNIQPMWRNFAGEERQFNPEGKRNFCIPLTEEAALAMYEAGWPVKDNSRKVDAGLAEELLYHLKVTVKMNGRRPPRAFLITLSRNRRVQLDDDTIALLDVAEFDKVDVILRAYNYDINGKQGVSVYLKDLYAVLHESELEKEWSHVPIAGEEEEEGVIELENVVDAVVEADTGWAYEDGRKELPRGSQ